MIFPKVCELYGHCDDPNPSIDVYPVFSCGNADLKGGNGVSFYEDNFKIIPEKLKSQNGQGNLDYVIDAKPMIDGEQDVDNVFGIVTDAKEWYFVECTLDREGKPSFKLSEPEQIVINLSAQGDTSILKSPFNLEPQTRKSFKHYLLGLKSGANFMIVDCGGGAVDLTMRKLTGNNQISEIQEIIVEVLLSSIRFPNICIRRVNGWHENGRNQAMRRTRTEAEISKVVALREAESKVQDSISISEEDDDSDYVLPEEEEDSDYVASDDEDQNPSPLLTSSQFKCFAESLIHSWIIDLNDREAEAQFTVEEWKEIRCEIRKLPEFDESFVDSMMRFADIDSSVAEVDSSWEKAMLNRSIPFYRNHFVYRTTSGIYFTHHLDRRYLAEGFIQIAQLEVLPSLVENSTHYNNILFTMKQVRQNSPP
ncbi:hypothetical protein GLOIN_2v1774909 [Rhizophagus irregularis DAOM 181602=DAOM 197198]|nr:hypothetical protein GLOIN_2v1774909 [Rhizophagus irregularis DAOM 181602=DAOM 197198]